MGYEYSTVVIRRVSGEPCTFRDEVKFIDGVFDGAAPTELAISLPVQQEPQAVLLAGPGDAATFTITVLARCANGPDQPRSSPAKSLQLALARTGDLAVSAKTDGLNYGCLPHTSRIAVGDIVADRK